MPDFGINLGGAVATGLSMLGQKKREERALKNQEYLMGIQLGNQQTLNSEAYQRQRLLNEQARNLQMQTWKETNFPAQMKMLREAGLNPALLYGTSGGGGGSTAGSSGGSSPSGGAAGGSAPAPQPMDLQNMLLGSQIKLFKAQASKTEAEASVIKETGTEEAKSRISKLIAETENEYAKKDLAKIQTDLARIDTANRQYIIDAEVNNILEQTTNLKLNNRITQEATDAIIEELEQTALLRTVQVESEQAKVNLTEAQIKQIAESIKAKWSEIAIQWRQLRQKDTELAQRLMEISIKEFDAEIRAEYPNLWQSIGSIAKKGYKTLENITIKGKGLWGSVKDKVEYK